MTNNFENTININNPASWLKETVFLMNAKEFDEAKSQTYQQFLKLENEILEDKKIQSVANYLSITLEEIFLWKFSQDELKQIDLEFKKIERSYSNSPTILYNLWIYYGVFNWDVLKWRRIIEKWLKLSPESKLEFKRNVYIKMLEIDFTHPLSDYDILYFSVFKKILYEILDERKEIPWIRNYFNYFIK